MSATIDELVAKTREFKRSTTVKSVHVDHMDTLKPLYDFPGGWVGSLRAGPPSFYELLGIPVFVEDDMPPSTVEFRDCEGKTIQRFVRG